jgi:aminoglycoside phosphotransferase (APT) family kinase protein
MAPTDKGSTARDAMAGWLRSSAGLLGQLHWRQVAGGLSNITYVVTDETGRRVVVRRPPRGELTGGAHDVLREARILAALRPTAVPVPAVLAACQDPEVAGAPFYVMEHAAGAVLESAESARRLTLPQRRQLGFELIDVLCALQAVDLDAVGLATMRRGTPYLERQIRRWNAQWTATASRVVPAIDDVSSRLQKILPTVTPQPDCLVHGDFRFGNVMVTGNRETGESVPRISALLDWELATTGHPLADLGFLGARMRAPAGVLEPGPDPSAVDGFPSYGDLAGRFRQRTGVSIDDLGVFVALSAWRWAIIAEGIQQRFARGEMGEVEADAAWHRRRVELLATFAADVLG